MAGKEDRLPIYKSNALVEAGYRLTAMEQRILLACIAQVRRWDDTVEITDADWYRVTVADIESLTGNSTKTIYADLRAAALRLKRREVWIKDGPNGSGRLPEMLITGWVQSIKPIKGEGCVDLRFSRDVLPYISQITKHFTRYDLADVARMTSVHAMRLYELLQQWSSSGSRTVSVRWLKEVMQLTDRYPAIKDFKERVIKPAVAQINAHSPLRVSWDQRKTGVRVTHLTFTFKAKSEPKNKGQPPAISPPPSRESRPPPSYIDTPYIEPRRPANNGGLSKSDIERQAKPGETWEEAAQRLRNRR